MSRGEEHYFAHSFEALASCQMPELALRRNSKLLAFEKRMVGERFLLPKGPAITYLNIE